MSVFIVWLDWSSESSVDYLIANKSYIDITTSNTVTLEPGHVYIIILWTLKNKGMKSYLCYDIKETFRLPREKFRGKIQRCFLKDPYWSLKNLHSMLNL